VSINILRGHGIPNIYVFIYFFLKEIYNDQERKTVKKQLLKTYFLHLLFVKRIEERNA
jgi:hypothetical protein